MKEYKGTYYKHLRHGLWTIYANHLEYIVKGYATNEASVKIFINNDLNFK